MKRKQRIIILFCVLIIILAGTVMGVKSYQDKMKNRLWSSKWEDSFWSQSGRNYTENGILYQQDSYIRFCDNTSDKDDLICVDQNCSHEASKDSSCGAYVYASVLAGIAIRGEHMMYIADSKDGYGRCALYVADLEGKGRKKIGNLMKTDLVYDVLYHKNMIYISYMRMENDKQDVSVYGIYAYDLQKRKGRNLFRNTGNGYSPDGMVMGDKLLYISYAYSDASKEEILAHREDQQFDKKHVKMCVNGLDPKSGKVRKVLDGFGNNSVLMYKKGHLFYTKDKDLYCYFEKKDSAEKINEKGDYIAIPGGQETKAYFRALDPKTGKFICVIYDITAGKWTSQVTDSFFPEAIRGDYIYGTDSSNILARLSLKEMEKGDVSQIHTYESQWDAE